MGDSSKKLFTVLVLCVVGATETIAQRPTIDEFFRNFSDEWVRLDPNLAVAARYFPSEEQARLDRQLSPYTDEYSARRRALAQRGLTALRRFNQADMTAEQRMSAQVLDWQLQTVVDEEKYERFNYPLAPRGGANVDLVDQFTVWQPVRNAQEADNYVVRLQQVGARMREATAAARDRAAKGIVPPRFIVDATIKQMQAFVGTPAVDNPFVSTLWQKMIETDVPAESRDRARTRAAEVLEASVYPAWRDAILFLQEVLPRTRETPGLSRFKDGRAAYDARLRRYTTSNLTADQIHEIGLQQVSKLESELEALLKKIGRSQGSLVERLQQIADELRYPATEDGRKQILADADAILRDAERRAALQFDKRPQIPVVVQPYPRFEENNAAASYAIPPADGSRPGVFRIPLRPGRYMSKFGLRSVVYHEAVPGHHFQYALQVENTSQPQFRRFLFSD